jgi:glucose/arabinose dehydrogenase
VKISNFVAVLAPAFAVATDAGTSGNAISTASCEGNAEITVPTGFCASIFADSIQHARYIAIAENGDVYVSIEGTNPQQKTTLPAFAALRDTNRDGRADVIERVGERGNTGIALYNGFLYVDQGEKITRYRRAAGQLVPSNPETVVDGLPVNPGHRARNFLFTSDGTMYVNVGSPSNACQVKDRALESPGKDPCEDLATRAGIWKFRANSINQHFSSGARYATGARNSTGIALGDGGRIYAMVHGRDQLTQNWPKVFPDTAYGDENPAESMILVTQGGDYGWPYCYYAFDQKHLVDAPEYGGDGKKTSRCTGKQAPVATYPAHWAPLDLLVYNGSAFPAKYRGGAFITFHGSWNRKKGMQAGGKIVFQPMPNGTPGGAYEVFADQFAGVPADEIDPNRAKHRPVGLAIAPDGSMYVADDKGGRIYRITYNNTP